MDGTEVLVGAWVLELERILVVGIQRSRSELVIYAHDNVRYVVPVDPGYFRSRRYRQLHWSEAEVIDGDCIRCGFFLGRRHRGPSNRTAHQHKRKSEDGSCVHRTEGPGGSVFFPVPESHGNLLILEVWNPGRKISERRPAGDKKCPYRPRPCISESPDDRCRLDPDSSQCILSFCSPYVVPSDRWFSRVALHSSRLNRTGEYSPPMPKIGVGNKIMGNRVFKNSWSQRV